MLGSLLFVWSVPRPSLGPVLASYNALLLLVAMYALRASREGWVITVVAVAGLIVSIGLVTGSIILPATG